MKATYSDFSTASMIQEALMDEICKNSKLGTVCKFSVYVCPRENVKHKLVP